MKNTLLIIFALLFAVNLSTAQNSIVQYEYWLNNDIQSKVVKQASGAVLNLEEDIDVTGAKLGYNIFNIRFKDRNDKYSSTFSKFFFYGGKSAQSENEIVELEYWAGSDYEGAKKVSISVDENIIENLDLKDLSNGFHLISIRFRDVAGLWSSPISKYVFKAGSSESAENLITEYRYWTDDNFTTATTVKLDKPIALYELNSIIELPNESAETFNIQFLDIAGLWSVVYTRAFTPEAGFEVFNTINTYSFKNTTTFGSTYLWKFGDGTQSELVHPTHSYTQPGVYEVSLIATNNLGKDTAYQLVTVNGIREVVSTKGGNAGFTTINVYGGGFKDGSKVWLEKDGVKYLDAENVLFSRLDALESRFDLVGKALGIYDVVVELPNGTKLKLDDAFEIVQGTMPEPYVNFNGRDRILFGRWQTYTIDFGNTGNNDALGVPVYFMVTMPAGFEIEFKNLDIKISEYWKSHPDYQELDVEPFYLEHTGYFDGPERIRLYAFYIPVIPANFSGQIELRIKTNASFKSYTWFNEPMFEVVPEGIVLKQDEILSSAMDKKTAACLRAVMFQAMKDGIAEVVNNVIPGVGCANSILNMAFQPADYIAPDPTNPEYTRPKSWSEKIWGWGGTLKDLTFVIAGCASDLLPLKQAYKTAVAVMGVINNIYGGIQAGRECYKKYGNGKKDVTAVSSFDPNEIVGPGGFSAENYVNTPAFGYTIFFENLPAATAPAQEVVIIDTLDATKFDLESFSFGQFAFGGQNYNPLPGLKEFTLDVDDTKTGNIVRVNGKFDTQTAIATWQFITLDPTKMDLTEDPDGGFLPPNKQSPEGEGNVFYSVNLLNSLQDEAHITAKADIFFDLNPPIVTNTYSNKLDYSDPSSKLTGIYYTATPNMYKVTSTSSDEGSGVRHNIIYASVNGGEYLPLTSSNQETFYLELEADSTYYFFSQAIDSVGNAEPLKSTYEISTLNVSVTDKELNFDNFTIVPNPAEDFADLVFNLEEARNVIISVYDYTGRVLFIKHLGAVNVNHTEQIDLMDFQSGKYLIRASIGNTSVIKMLNIVR